MVLLFWLVVCYCGCLPLIAVECLCCVFNCLCALFGWFPVGFTFAMVFLDLLYLLGCVYTYCWLLCVGACLLLSWVVGMAAFVYFWFSVFVLIWIAACFVLCVLLFCWCLVFVLF